MRQKKNERDRAIAELLEPLSQKQRAKDYADFLNPPFVQKPLLNNDWAGLAEKVFGQHLKLLIFLVFIGHHLKKLIFW